MSISNTVRMQLAISAGRGSMRDLETLLRNLPIDTPDAAISDVSENQGEMTSAERIKFNLVLGTLRKFGFISS